MSTTYDAAAIEVLTGLEPVRKRPGMYTDTSRPNHLVQEDMEEGLRSSFFRYENPDLGSGDWLRLELVSAGRDREFDGFDRQVGTPLASCWC